MPTESARWPSTTFRARRRAGDSHARALIDIKPRASASPPTRRHAFQLATRPDQGAKPLAGDPPTRRSSMPLP